MRSFHPFKAALPLGVAALGASLACQPALQRSTPFHATSGVAPAPTLPSRKAATLNVVTPKTATPNARVVKPLAAWQIRAQAQDRELVRGLSGQLLQRSLPPSELVANRRLTAFVYLPPGYNDVANAQKRYPVAYILHGAPGGVRDCFVNARVHRVAERLILAKKVQPMILVGWDASGPRGADDAVYYLDRRDGYRMETFTTQVLVPWVDAGFRTQARAESRALLGFSAGGFGAANLGFKHPDVWRVIASHSGFFNPRDDIQEMTKILGPLSPVWDANDPIARAREAPNGTRLHFYMDVGRDDDLLGEFRQMERELRARNMDFQAHIFSGAHTWQYLSAHYTDSLLFCDERWKEMRVSKS